MRAAVDLLPGLDAVANHLATAVGTLRRKGMDGALETVIMMRLALHNHLNRLVVIVAANFTFHTHTTEKRGKPGALSARSAFPGEPEALLNALEMNRVPIL